MMRIWGYSERTRLNGGALPATRPHQVDRRQQVSGETDDDEQNGDSEREGEPLGRATSRRVQGVPRTAS
jgi:hypothetical protein